VTGPGAGQPRPEGGSCCLRSSAGPAAAAPVLVRAYNTEQDCARGITAALDFFAKIPNMVARKGHGYVCPPVAVDPRDLKEK
jgi:hypothetical protein